MRDRRILIVDDEEDILRGLEKIMKAKGMSPSTARSGMEAVELLKTNDFSLIISDLMMPGMSGLELLEVVKKDYPHPVYSAYRAWDCGDSHKGNEDGCI